MSIISIVSSLGVASQAPVVTPDPPTTNPVLIKSSIIGGEPDRVDALALSRLSPTVLYGSYNWGIATGGGDEGEYYQKVIFSHDNGVTYQDGPLLPYSNNGELNGVYYKQNSGNIIQIAASFMIPGEQFVEVRVKKSIDGGLTYDAGTVICGSATERWVHKTGNSLLKLPDGLLLFTIAFADNDTQRTTYIFKSTDDGNTWSLVESAEGVTLRIENTGGGALYATEPGLYIASDGKVVCYFRTKDGICRGTKLTRNGNYFDKSSLTEMWPAPASTSDCIHLPAIGKWFAVSNDPNDDESGNFDGTSRKNLIYHLSDTGDPGSFTTMPNKIRTWINDGYYVFEPACINRRDGVIVAYTVYNFDNQYNQYTRYLTNAMILEEVEGAGGWT